MNARIKNILYLLCLLFFSIGVQSQNTVLDSLKNELSVHPQRDSTRVNLLNELAYMYHVKNLDKTTALIEESETIANAIDFKKGKARILLIKGKIQAAKSSFDVAFGFMQEAQQLYHRINYKPGISECFNAIGSLFYDKGEQMLAIENYKKSISVNEEINNRKGISVSSNNIGKAYANLGNYTEALNYHNKALKISKEIGDEKRMSSSLNNIGTIHSDQGNYPLALEYYNESLAIDEKFGDTLELAKSLNNVGIIYKNLQNYDKAIVSYKKALDLQRNQINKKNTAEILNNLGLVYKRKKNYTLAQYYLKEALKISEEINNLMYIATCLNNIADVDLLVDDHIGAYNSFENARKINLEVNNQRGLCNSYLGLAKVHIRQKEYVKALTSALKSKEISDKLDLINYQSEVQEILVIIYEKLGDYKKALLSHQQFKILNDSLFNKENIEKITQLEYEYKYQQAIDSASIRELKLTKEVSSINTNLEKSQKNIFLTIIAFLSITIILGGIIFLLKWRNVKEKNQNILIEQKLLRSQMTPHFIFNSLSVLQGMILNKEEDKSITYLSKFSKLLRIVLENSRDKVVPLIQELDAIDNYMVLQNLDTDPPYYYSLVVDENIDINSFQIPPMLIQPFIENAIEHAFPDANDIREMVIHLKFIDEKLICTITDNGIGIDAISQKVTTNKKSLATTITSERLLMLAKEFKVIGAIIIEDRKKYNDRGTIVTLTIPYKISHA